jgi:hypothetical protein
MACSESSSWLAETAVVRSCSKPRKLASGRARSRARPDAYRCWPIRAPRRRRARQSRHQSRGLHTWSRGAIRLRKANGTVVCTIARICCCDLTVPPAPRTARAIDLAIGPNHCLLEIPSGRSHDAPFAVRRPAHRPRHALASTSSGGAVISGPARRPAKTAHTIFTGRARAAHGNRRYVLLSRVDSGGAERRVPG